MPHSLHVISFDVPYPANYGGAIDVFYKLKALKEIGVEVVLHCFVYGGRGPAVELEDVVQEVNYYKRKSRLVSIFSNKPMIVKSRESEKLNDRLKQDNHPILMEGIHSSGLLQNKLVEDRVTAVRMHNVESAYYEELARSETDIVQKQYYKDEAKKLRDYEKTLSKADHILAISQPDTEYFRTFYKQTSYLPAFHSNDKVTAKAGSGLYCLYHGNLSVNENKLAAAWLIKEVFAGLDVPLIIAGSKPSKTLIELVHKHPEVRLIADPSEEKMNELIQEAHIHVLPTFQRTGIKLKLLNALHRGRHLLVSPSMVDNTGLEKLCVIQRKPDDWKLAISELMLQSFTDASIAERTILLNGLFDNRTHAELLKNLLYA